MAHIELDHNRDALTARIAELEAQLMQADNEHQQKTTTLRDRVLELEAQKRELELEVNEVRENGEFADEQRIQVEEELAQAQQTIHQQTATIAQLQEQVDAANNELVQAQNVIQGLQADLDEAHNDFMHLIHIQAAQNNPQPFAEVPPGEEEEVSGLDSGPPPTPLADEELSDAESHAPHA